jgi:hypothetical protein
LSVVTLRTASVAAVEKARLAAETDPFEVPAATCPRCLARRADTAESCPTCGVVFAQLAPATLAPPEWLAAAWRELLLRWDDEPLHEQLRARAYEEQELATLGRLYRLRLAWNAEDPWAQQGRDEVLRLATAPVALVRPERPSSTFRYVVVGALLLGVLVVFIALVRLVLQSVA